MGLTEEDRERLAVIEAELSQMAERYAGSQEAGGVRGVAKAVALVLKGRRLDVRGSRPRTTEGDDDPLAALKPRRI